MMEMRAVSVRMLLNMFHFFSIVELRLSMGRRIDRQVAW
jgi:hypothetical protein